MAREAKGSFFRSRDQFFAQVSLGGRRRKAVQLPHAKDETQAREQAKYLAAVVKRIRRSGKADPSVDLADVVKEGAGAFVSRDARREFEKMVEEVCRGARYLRVGRGACEKAGAVTFKTIGQQWTSGDLARAHKDHVRAKRSAKDDEGRLEVLYDEIGNIPVTADGWLDHAERAMRKLPPKLSPATRRHYAQLISRVLALACYPLRLIKINPLPRGFLPKLGKPKAGQYIYPTEDVALMACTEIPLPYRVLYGFLAREGLRVSEATGDPAKVDERGKPTAHGLTWADFDLERGGVKLDQNKTDDPRAWALNPGVAHALRHWRKMRADEPETARVFVDETGRRFEGRKLTNLAHRLRAHLAAAEVTRAELEEKSDVRRPVNVHSLRATFVTVALATGRTETWVQDRTGHTTSAMLARYRRLARTFSELGLGDMSPLDQAIPEFAQLPAEAAPIASETQNSENKKSKRQHKLSEKAEVAEWQTRRIQNSRDPLPAGTTVQSNRGFAVGGDAQQVVADRPAGNSQAIEVDVVADSRAIDVDVVEEALAHAIRKAADESEWGHVGQLTRELEARRARAASNVVDLASERAKR